MNKSKEEPELLDPIESSDEEPSTLIITTMTNRKTGQVLRNYCVSSEDAKRLLQAILNSNEKLFS